ncbi:unnamed protein product [Malus baccata var. baccata]|uniref:NAC domain-containing protein n=1 Tax=Malus domestica TaxID=3750 RepID=A0A498IG44_MALDO|nr:hypothetical protein DVH24_005036 [Malus domestica]
MTDWKMHEYKLSNETDPPKKIDGTDMKIYKISRGKTDKKNDNAAKSTIESDQEAIDLPAVSNC